MFSGYASHFRVYRDALEEILKDSEHCRDIYSYSYQHCRVLRTVPPNTEVFLQRLRLWGKSRS